MHIQIRLLLFFLMTAGMVSGVCMESDQKVPLKYGERTTLGNGVFVTYSSFGHEHVSYGPDEPFAATVAIYGITLDSGAGSEMVYLALDIRGESAPETVATGGYVFWASPESTQDTLVLRWRAVESCR